MKQTYDFTFEGPNHNGRYKGLWRVPGDLSWRVCRSPIDGQNFEFKTALEACENAARHLVGHLNKTRG